MILGYNFYMDNNTLQLLNNTIYQIYNIEDFDSMKREILRSLKLMIPNKCGSILMAGSGSMYSLADPVCDPEKYKEMEERYIVHENRDSSSWILHKNRTVILKISELMSDAEREKTDVYRNCFAPYGLHYSLDMTITYRGELLGDVTLYRGREEEDFSDDDVMLMMLLSDHLNARFYSNKYGKRTVQESGIGQIGELISQYSLTKREAEVLNLIFHNKDNIDICEELFISENTLKKHLHNLYRKTGVSGRVQLLGINRK